MSSRPKAPCVDVRTDVHKDARFEVLGELAGYNRFEAIGRMHALWSWCVDRGLKDAPDDEDGYVVSEAVVRRFLGQNGAAALLADDCDELALGERRADGRVYLRGTSEYVAERRARALVASAGGTARASATRDDAGRFVIPTTHVQPAPSREPAERPAANQPTPASSSSSSEISDSPAPRAIVQSVTWHQRKAWWDELNAAHGRLRAPTAKRAAIKPNTPDFAKGPNENMLLACERFLRDGGYDAAGIDAKIRHVIAIAELEAEREQHLDYFKPAIIFDVASPNRFPRKVDTSIEEAARDGAPKNRAGPRRVGELIGAAAPRTDHPVSPGLIPISEIRR